MKEAVIVFTRIPVPGKTKTRLMPVYSAEECAELHICFLKDILQQCAESAKDLYLYYTPSSDTTLLFQFLDTPLQCLPQQGNGLGERMLHAVTEVLHKGYDACILIGSDIPEITSVQLLKAFALLRDTDVVFLPAADGGYCLIGMKEAIPQAFCGQKYGLNTVLENTIHALTISGYTTMCFDQISDIDTPADIIRLRKQMMCNLRLQRSITGEYLKAHRKISVIIPIYNEESTIHLIQRELEKLKDCDILFVDGGSTDRTIERIHPAYRVIASRKGRAVQMNEGAKNSSGDTLFFLHADSRLPEDPVDEIRNVMLHYRWGCFGIDFGSSGFALWICGVLSNYRAKVRRLVFGDQGIFIDRDLFETLGMFPELPIMEDYQLSLTLKKRNITPGMTKSRILTSPRRFGGNILKKLRLMQKMHKLRLMYRQGVDIQTIASLYQDIR